jgi:NitT/TauT family transport system substrate-binding protein
MKRAARSRFGRTTAVALTASMVLATLAAHAQEPKKFIVGGATTTMTTLAAYFSSVPLEIYWKEEGISVELIGLPGATVALQALQSGKVDIVPGTNSAFFALLEKFPDAGLKAYFTITGAFNAMPMVRDDSPLRTVGDLHGKSVGVQTLANSQVPMIKALLKQAGGDPNSLTFLAVGEGMEAAHALATRRVDALALYDGLYAAIEAEGVKLHELTSDFVDRQKVGFNSGLLVRQGDLEKNRNALVKVGRGIAKAILFCQTNPEAAVRVHWKVYPATKPRGVPEEEAMRRSLMPLKARLKNIDMPGDLFGNSTEAQIKGYMNLLVAGGQMKQAIDVAQVWDPSLLKEINAFDRHKVIDQAKSWRP